jgi:hypothetical protein
MGQASMQGGVQMHPGGVMPQMMQMNPQAASGAGSPDAMHMAGYQMGADGQPGQTMPMNYGGYMMQPMGGVQGMQGMHGMQGMQGMPMGMPNGTGSASNMQQVLGQQVPGQHPGMQPGMQYVMMNPGMQQGMQGAGQQYAMMPGQMQNMQMQAMMMQNGGMGHQPGMGGPDQSADGKAGKSSASRSQAQPKQGAGGWGRIRNAPMPGRPGFGDQDGMDAAGAAGYMPPRSPNGWSQGPPGKGGVPLLSQDPNAQAMMQTGNAAASTTAPGGQQGAGSPDSGNRKKPPRDGYWADMQDSQAGYDELLKKFEGFGTGAPERDSGDSKGSKGGNQGGKGKKGGRGGGGGWEAPSQSQAQKGGSPKGQASWVAKEAPAPMPAPQYTPPPSQANMFAPPSGKGGGRSSKKKSSRETEMDNWLSERFGGNLPPQQAVSEWDAWGGEAEEVGRRGSGGGRGSKSKASEGGGGGRKDKGKGKGKKALWQRAG